MVMVLYTHLGLYDALPDVPWLRERGWHLFGGWVAVRVFFVISGFLITRMLLQERARTGTISIRRFYIRRALRLLPAFVIHMVILALWRALGICDTSTAAMLVSFFYLYNYMPTIWYDGLLGHTWTLAVEEQFYILWPLLLRGLSRLRLDLLLAAVFVACALVELFVPDARIPGSQSVLFRNLFHVPRWFLPAAAPIVVGVLACLHYVRAQRIMRPGRRGALVLFFFCAPLWMPVFCFPLAYPLQSIGIGLALVWLLQKQEGGAARFLEWAPLAYMGRITYGIYLYHLLFIAVDHPAPIFHLPFNLLAIFALAIVSYELVERPVLRLKERFR